jgi:hypothetical protein
MRALQTIQVTDANLQASDVPETDAALWLVGSTYAVDDEVMLDHHVYRSVLGSNTGNDPRVDDGTNWLDLGFTNRWRAFDKKTQNLVAQADSITYTISADNLITGVAVMNYVGSTVTVEVRDVSATLLSTHTKSRNGGQAITSWWIAFTIDLAAESIPDVIFEDVRCYPGNNITVTVATAVPGSIVSLGLLLLGVTRELGETNNGTAIGIKDYSTKDKDPFGNAILVERVFASTVNFSFSLPTDRAAFVRRTLAALRATPTLYYAGVDQTQFGAQVFGFFQDFEIPLTGPAISFANLKVEEL